MSLIFCFVLIASLVVSLVVSLFSCLFLSLFVSLFCVSCCVSFVSPFVSLFLCLLLCLSFCVSFRVSFCVSLLLCLSPFHSPPVSRCCAQWEPLPDVSPQNPHTRMRRVVLWTSAVSFVVLATWFALHWEQFKAHSQIWLPACSVLLWLMLKLVKSLDSNALRWLVSEAVSHQAAVIADFKPDVLAGWSFGASVACFCTAAGFFKGGLLLVAPSVAAVTRKTHGVRASSHPCWPPPDLQRVCNQRFRCCAGRLFDAAKLVTQRMQGAGCPWHGAVAVCMCVLGCAQRSLMFYPPFPSLGRTT